MPISITMYVNITIVVKIYPVKVLLISSIIIEVLMKLESETIINGGQNIIAIIIANTITTFLYLLRRITVSQKYVVKHEII